MMDQNAVIKQETQDHFSARENCKTPEKAQEYKVKGDTLKKCRHGHTCTNIHLEGCNDSFTADIMLNGYYDCVGNELANNQTCSALMTCF